jgi:hypothetical protein
MSPGKQTEKRSKDFHPTFLKLDKGYDVKYQLTAGVPYLDGDL